MLLQRTGGAGLYLPVDGITLIQAGADQARTFSFIGSCTSTGSSLDFSSLSAGAVAAGDLLVYIDYGGAGADPAAVTPSLFTNHINTLNSTTHWRGMVSSKKAAGGEGAITGINAGSTNSKIGRVFRPSTSFTTIAAAGISSEATTGNPVLQTCNPSGETSAVILVTISGDGSGGAAAFSTRSPAADASVGTSGGVLLEGYNIYNTSPQSTQVDMNDLGTANWLASLYFTVS